MGVGVERIFHDPVFGQRGVRGETFEFTFPGVFLGFDVFVFFGVKVDKSSRHQHD